MLNIHWNLLHNVKLNQINCYLVAETRALRSRFKFARYLGFMSSGFRLTFYQNYF